MQAAHSRARVRRDPGGEAGARGEVRGKPASGGTVVGGRGTRSGDELEGGRSGKGGGGVAGIVPASGPVLGSGSLMLTGTALGCLWEA